MEQDSDQKIVVLTGASRGIGHATVKKFASENWRVITCSRQAFDDRCPWPGGEMNHIQLDLSNPNQTIEAIEEIKSKIGPNLHALVNNAGIRKDNIIAMMPSEDWQQVMDINLTGTFFMCSHAIPMLLESKGAIVNVSSTAALGAHAWTAAYSASKGGISAFSKTLAVEYGMQGLNINCVCPASIETPMSTNPKMPKC